MFSSLALLHETLYFARMEAMKETLKEVIKN
jgi:hypothetical protein